MNLRTKTAGMALLTTLVAIFAGSQVGAQSVCLPSPHLLTTNPMGGQAGTAVEVIVTGDNLEDVEALRFSHPGLTAQPKRDDAGQPVANTFVVSIDAECPAGLYESRVMTRLGISSSRVFSVDTLPEITRTTANTALDKATELPLDTICNAYTTAQAVDHYSIEVPANQRIIVESAARGIDSKLHPVLILADAQGNDLQVQRRGGNIDYTVTEAGKYIVKLHDLTFNGGTTHFYRLIVRTATANTSFASFPSTQAVGTFSWPPAGLAASNTITETAPDDRNATPQPITLPCDIAGRFFPAADVDAYEFTAKKGETWWVEVASERLGCPTDPALVVQRVTREGESEQLSDVVEMNDIASPVKVSSNGYAYDGPRFNAGSADINGKLEIPEDGLYRLQLTDLFGGTRSEPTNIYRLIVREAQPDFAVVGWPLHMELRNGDRNALSKPIALRGGETMSFEVVVVRRDGFDGEIELVVESLPPGVSASGLTIAAGKTRSIVLFTADQDAPRGVADATFFGRATINGEVVARPGRFSEVAWPVKDHWQEIPQPRLISTIPVSVSGHEFAALTISAADDRVWEAKSGETLTIPLVHTRRCDFSGANISLKTFGCAFESNAAFDASLAAESSEAKLDLAKLKVQPGDYTIAFYGSAVAKWRDRPDLEAEAEEALVQAKAAAEAAAAKSQAAAANAESATEDDKATLLEAAQQAATQQTAADEAVKAAEKRLQAATNRAKPTDIVDIIVSEPIHIRVLPAEEAEKK